MNVLVYNGEGASTLSVNHVTERLKFLLGHKYDVISIDAQALRTEPWEDSCALLVVPGGRDLPYVRDLPANSISNFVSRGGRYIGFCAGSYYASSEIEFMRGVAGMEVCGKRELGFFPGLCRGPIYPGFTYEGEQSARAETVIISEEFRHRAQKSFGYPVEKEISMYYNGGGYFVDADCFKNVEVLARYKMEDNQEHPQDQEKAAVIKCSIGKGAAVLFGPHTEYVGSLLDARNNYASGVIERLRADDLCREHFLRTILDDIGLHVTKENTQIPLLTPLYLLSEVPQLSEQLGLQLKRIGETNGLIRCSNDNFQLVENTDQSYLLEITEAESGKPKPLVVCRGGPPNPALLPYFDAGEYFQRLSEYRQNARQLFAPDMEFGSVVLYGEVVTSTQTILEKNHELGQIFPNGLVFVATKQIAGRGRGRNSWISPAGCLQFSLLLRFPLSANASPVFIQYLAGLAIVEAVRTRPGYEEIPLRLKWPNDIYAELQDGTTVKIGGILVNSSFTKNEFTIVVGCGINTSNPLPTTSINHIISRANQVHGSRLEIFSQETLLAAIMVKFEAFYRRFLLNGFDNDLMKLYTRRWLHSGQVITLAHEEPHRLARILGLTKDFGLLETEEIDEQGKSTGKIFQLQPDGNSFDMLKGLIKRK
ncbi:uncharacterized protein VTP21DRAFT_11588 [Calcarisporiella thermophila]|uniref:uncharacterized protein n=1 Tax=Calcarisporiella thermophila TaxID=911321 RepID=UPI003743652F